MERTHLDALVARTMETFGRVDILVNNAGGTPPTPALDTSQRMFEEAFRFNVTTAFVLTRLCVPHMLANGRRRDRQHLLGGRAPRHGRLRRLRRPPRPRSRS